MMTLPFTYRIPGACLVLMTATILSCQPPVQETIPEVTKRAIIGYVPGFTGIIDVSAINANKLTHINYAFVDVKDSLAWLTNIASDTINFRNLNQLKKINADLKILISIGGWSWSENFSDAVLTENSRNKFAWSAKDIVERYDLDGVDIDWEYPGQRGQDNVFRPEDKQNYTHMFEALRMALDSLTDKTGKKYLLTTAVGGNARYIENTEMDKVGEILDYVNLMTYDYYTSGDSAGHHTNLYRADTISRNKSADNTFNLFLEAGVPQEKMLLGIAFYGRSWFMRDDDNLGINRPVFSVTRVPGYSMIKDSVVKVPGYTLYWDDNAKAPYIFNSETNQLISFDDERSVQHKCAYVSEHNMAGVFFWQYMDDPKEYLLDEINKNLP